MFEHSVPGLPERAAADGLTPLQWMRRYGAFEISKGGGALHEQPVAAAELAVPGSRAGRVYTATSSRTARTSSPPVLLNQTTRAAARPACRSTG